MNCAKADERAADDETQDLLHSLELDETLTYYQKADLAKRISSIRKSRRVAKNTAWVSEPIVKWAEDNATAIKAMEKLLGEVRKIEQSQENRVYVPKSEKTEPVMVAAINDASVRKKSGKRK